LRFASESGAEILLSRLAVGLVAALGGRRGDRLQRVGDQVCIEFVDAPIAENLAQPRRYCRRD